MLAVYINYPTSRISIHQDPGCYQIQPKERLNQRVVCIDKVNVVSEVKKLNSGYLKFSAIAGLNDVWVHINLGDVSSEENLVVTIRDILGNFYKPLARAEIKTHCQSSSNLRVHSAVRDECSGGEFRPSSRGGKNSIPDRNKKIEAVVSTINSRISKINFRYRTGPSLYFYRRIMELRKTGPKISDFLSDNYNFEILYATLVSWDMNSRGAKLKYFDDFKSAIISCLPQLEAIESEMESFNPAQDNDMLRLLKSTYLRMELMETSGRLVSNSKCLHFLLPSLCMPMDGTNTLRYLIGNTYESASRYLDIIQFSFEVMRQPVEFKKYLDDRWNQNVPKIIDNAIILLSGKSIKNLVVR